MNLNYNMIRNSDRCRQKRLLSDSDICPKSLIQLSDRCRFRTDVAQSYKREFTLSISVNSRFCPYRNFPHLSITNSVTRQGGSINIIQVTVYSFTVPALKLMKVKFCLFLTTTAHCHDRAAIKIHITTFNRINLHLRCGNLDNFNCFWLSINLYTFL